MFKGVYHISAMAAALAFVTQHNEAARNTAGMSMIDPVKGLSDLKRAMNGKKRGGSVKANARKAYKVRARKRAKRNGQR